MADSINQKLRSKRNDLDNILNTHPEIVQINQEIQNLRDRLSILRRQKRSIEAKIRDEDKNFRDVCEKVTELKKERNTIYKEKRINKILAESKNIDEIIGTLRATRCDPAKEDEECCSICMDLLKCVAFLPCNHLCTCTHCAIKILETNKKCPVCREVTIEARRIY